MLIICYDGSLLNIVPDYPFLITKQRSKFNEEYYLWFNSGGLKRMLFKGTEKECEDKSYRLRFSIERNDSSFNFNYEK